jgi:hypothetical protein
MRFRMIVLLAGAGLLAGLGAAPEAAAQVDLGPARPTALIAISITHPITARPTAITGRSGLRTACLSGRVPGFMDRGAFMGS